MTVFAQHGVPTVFQLGWGTCLQVLTDKTQHPLLSCFAGGGAIQLIIPQIYDSLAKHYPDFVAWRWSFFFPGTLHVVVAALVLFAATV